tara:strand:- start:216 stop:443 length:228 start_codon:yes stop_codon:yes gene_type:complete
METYRITCREWSYFVKEVKANSEDEAREKLHSNVNSFETPEEWIEEWEIVDTETKEDHLKCWVNLPPATGSRQKS